MTPAIWLSLLDSILHSGQPMKAHSTRRTQGRPRTTKTTICFEERRVRANPLVIKELRAKSRIGVRGRLLFFVAFRVQVRRLLALRAQESRWLGTRGSVPKVGLEPTPTCVDRILSPARLPFRHFGYSRLFYGPFAIRQAVVLEGPKHLSPKALQRLPALVVPN